MTSLEQSGVYIAINSESSITTILSTAFIGIFLFVLIILSVTGNTLVCAAILRKRDLRRNGNLFILSLATADLLVAGLVMPFAALNDLLGYWLFGQTLCGIWIGMDVMCCTASILCICAVAMDRFIQIERPFWYRCHVTKQVVKIFIYIIWATAFLVSFLPISFKLHQPSNPTVVDNPEPTCSLDLTPEYAIFSSSVSFFIPCFVTTMIYLRMYCLTQAVLRRPLATTSPLNHHSTTLPQSPYSKAAATIGIIILTFLGCWCPFFISNIIIAFCKTCIPGSYFKFLTWLGYSNSLFNPIIYSICRKNFRDEIRRSLSTRRRRRQLRHLQQSRSVTSHHRHPRPPLARREQNRLQRY